MQKQVQNSLASEQNGAFRRKWLKIKGCKAGKGLQTAVNGCQRLQTGLLFWGRKGIMEVERSRKAKFDRERQ